MVAFATTPVMRPSKDLSNRLVPPGHQLGLTTRAPPDPIFLETCQEERYDADLTWVILGSLLTLATVVLWPVLFVAIVLFLVVVSPLIAVSAAMRAIFRHRRRVAQVTVEKNLKAGRLPSAMSTHSQQVKTGLEGRARWTQRW